MNAPLPLLLPEALLATGLVATLLARLVPGAAAGRSPGRGGLAIAAVAAAAATVAAWTAESGALAAMLQCDGLAHVARAAIAFGTLLLLLAGPGAPRNGAVQDADAWAACVVSVGLGGLLVASAANTVPLWLGIELMSLPGYALAAWRAGDRRAAEAGTKYVLFGGLASGLMLFGISHLYGLTGHFDFAGIGEALGGDAPTAVIAALGLAGVGIAYKLTVVPFHVYAPDVYEGAPPTAVAVVATLPKIAAGAALLRALALAVPPAAIPHADLATALAVVAIASLAVGALLATVQRDARRILAFSGIGHGGTAVLAMTALPGAPGTSAALFQLLAYAIAALGAFVCLDVLERETGSTRLPALRGAGRRHPWVTAALCLFLLSLVGIPPLAGFLAKWGVLIAALGSGPVPFAAGLVLLGSTAVFAWAYLGIVRAVVLTDEPGVIPARTRTRLASGLVLATAAVLVIGLGLWLDVLDALARSVGS